MKTKLEKCIIYKVLIIYHYSDANKADGYDSQPSYGGYVNADSYGNNYASGYGNSYGDDYDYEKKDKPLIKPLVLKPFHFKCKLIFNL